MLSLRPYQIEALEAIRKGSNEGVSRQVVALPTGAGKTVVFAHLAAEESQEGRCLILAHRDELVHQTIEKLKLVAPSLPIGVVKAERNELDKPVILASVQTLARDSRLQQLPRDWRLLIVDECHHAEIGGNGVGNSWARIIDHVGAPLTVGFSATPFRPNGESIIGSVFEKVVYQKHLLNMIVDGYLTDITVRRVFVEGFNLKGVKSVGGDYSPNDLEDRLMDADAPKQIAAAIERYALGRRVGVFSPTVAHAEAVTAACLERGVASCTIVGETPWAEREAAYDAVKSGAVRVLSSCMVLTEGFDLPAIDCIVLARPTQSKVLYAQAIGRGLRPSTETNKENCLILDCTGATNRHNLMSVAEALGLADKPLKVDGSESLLDTLEREAKEREARAKPRDEADIRSRERNIIRRREMRWTETKRGAYVISLVGKMFRVRPQGNGRWTAEVRRTSKDDYETAFRQLAADLPLDYASGVAEDSIRTMRHEWATNRRAGWRKRPITPAQRKLCKKREIEILPGWTSGDAADALDRVKGDWYWGKIKR